MTGSYHDGAGRLSSRDRKSHHRRRGRLEAEAHLDIVAGYHLSSGSSEILRSEASVIADDYALFIKFIVLEIFGHGLGPDTHICKGEILGNNSSPPISAEFDRTSHSNLYAPSYSQLQQPGEFQIPIEASSQFQDNAVPILRHPITFPASVPALARPHEQCSHHRGPVLGVYLPKFSTDAATIAGGLLPDRGTLP